MEEEKGKRGDMNKWGWGRLRNNRRKDEYMG